jgi:UDP-glucose 4-epimerase
MRALVTGGAGFIGSTLVDRLLAEQHEVDVVDDLSTGSLANLAEARASGAKLRIHQLDIRADELVDLMVHRRPEVVFHLAAQASVIISIDRPIFDADVNVLGSLRVLEASRIAGVRKVVFAASGGSLYGDVEKGDLPVKEQAAQLPMSPYGISKKVVLDYLRVYREIHGLEFTACALANVYGPRQDAFGEAGVIAIFSNKLVRNERCTIMGDGDQTRDFVYVDDVVDAFARAAQRGSGLVANIGTGIATSVNEVYAILAEHAGTKRAATHAKARPGEVRDIALDPTRARLHLKWKPFTPLSVGLEHTLDYARSVAQEATTNRPSAKRRST